MVDIEKDIFESSEIINIDELKEVTLENGIDFEDFMKNMEEELSSDKKEEDIELVSIESEKNEVENDLGDVENVDNWRKDGSMMFFFFVFF
jgi:uncharacterized protein YeaO (DUF488 family)